MKNSGLSFQCESPFFVYFKRHNCPNCENKLVRQKVSEIVHSDSPEASGYDFEIADISCRGNVQFTHIEFFCSSCQRNFTVKELKAYGRKR